MGNAKKGQIIMKNKTIFLIFVVTIISSSCVLFDRAYYKSIIEFEDRIVQEYDNVASVKVLYNEDRIITIEEMHILIIFKDGQYIVLESADESGIVMKVSGRIFVECINGYKFVRYQRKLDEETVKRTYYVERIIKEGRLSVNKIIENFEIMSSFIDTLPIRDDKEYLENSDEWIFNKESFSSMKKIIDDYEVLDLKSKCRLCKGKPPLGYEFLKEDKEKWRRRLRK